MEQRTANLLELIESSDKVSAYILNDLYNLDTIIEETIGEDGFLVDDEEESEEFIKFVKEVHEIVTRYVKAQGIKEIDQIGLRTSLDPGAPGLAEAWLDHGIFTEDEDVYEATGEGRPLDTYFEDVFSIEAIGDGLYINSQTHAYYNPEYFDLKIYKLW